MRERTFSSAKSFLAFGMLKSILGNIFFKSGVIVIGVFSAFVRPILLFSHYADILMVTKSRNWKQERCQV